jgi:hypothetical protein
VDPGGAVWPTQKTVGFIITGYLPFGWVPIQASTELHGQIGEDARRSGNIALLDVSDWLGPLLNAGEQVFHVTADCLRDVPLEILLGFILWVLLEFIGQPLGH